MDPRSGRRLRRWRRPDPRPGDSPGCRTGDCCRQLRFETRGSAERRVNCRDSTVLRLKEQKKHLVDVGVPCQGPGEGAGPGHGLADVHLAAARLPHLHLHRTVRGNVLNTGSNVCLRVAFASVCLLTLANFSLSAIYLTPCLTDMQKTLKGIIHRNLAGKSHVIDQVSYCYSLFLP